MRSKQHEGLFSPAQWPPPATGHAGNLLLWSPHKAIVQLLEEPILNPFCLPAHLLRRRALGRCGVRGRPLGAIRGVVL